MVAAELLSDLVDKSLLTLADDRYRMLDTIRALHRNAPAAGERDRWQAAHARTSMTPQRRRPHLRAAEQLDCWPALTAEHGI